MIIAGVYIATKLISFGCPIGAIVNVVYDEGEWWVITKDCKSAISNTDHLHRLTEKEIIEYESICTEIKVAEKKRKAFVSRLLQ